MQRRLVSAFIALYLALHAWPVLLGIEDFPLTSALMFSRDVDAGRPLYTLHWWATDASGARSEVSPFALGLHPRHFFLHVYLPDHADSPYHGRARPADSPADYARRMSAWFGVLAERLAARTGETPERIDLLLAPWGDTPGERVRLGTYAVAERRFQALPDAGATAAR